jgi:hypothetical protein
MNISIGSIANIVRRNKYEREHVQPSQSVNTQLQTSTGNSTTFTPVYPSYERENVETLHNEDVSEVDFDNQPYDQLFEGDYNPALDGESGEKLLGYTETAETLSQNIKPDFVNNKYVFEGPTTTTEESKINLILEYQIQRIPRLQV